MIRLTAHPALKHPASRSGFAAVLVLRSAFFAFLVFLLDQLLKLGTSPYLASIAAAIGVLSGSLFAFSRYTTLATLLFAGIFYLSIELFFYLLNIVPLFRSESVFIPFLVHEHTILLFLILLLALISTLAFWRIRHALTAEILGILLLGIYLLRGHRNFRFDTPKLVSSLAWDLGIDPLSMLVLLGSFLVVTILVFVAFSSLPGKPPSSIRTEQIVVHRATPNYLLWVMIIAALGLYITLLARELYRYYHASAASRVANGVGQMNKDGISPLTFHSALGTSNQPAGLVRLEGDYPDNPFKPNLYLREAALSHFDGQQMVPAGAGFDTDVSFSHPHEAFTGTEDPELLTRAPLVQSVYLLADHTNAFAVDYPVSIKRLKNPKPGEFKAAYRAYSVAPIFKMSELEQAAAGDPRWPENIRREYLSTHPDKRYAELALKITEQAISPAQKARAVADYLSNNSIYTLSPNHEVTEDEDQTAPYLFGDMRGYCVHFAHATVYLLRAIGIPARIATGYLTDLSQSKDGHILLRMSDRHSWAEAYFQGYGWIPFDTQPTQVESHAETPVDMQLLEELMGHLDPGEEILPEEVTQDEPGLEKPAEIYIPSLNDFVLIAGIFLAILIAGKIYLRYSWILPSSTASRVRRAYVALISSLYDLGYRRHNGETRIEFGTRLGSSLGAEALEITPVLGYITYAFQIGDKVQDSHVSSIIRKDSRILNSFPKWKRILGAINPASVIALIARHRW